MRAGGRALALRCDVSLEADTRAAAEAAQAAFGRIDILVNAAATDDPNGTVVDIEPAEWTRVFAVNVMGAYLMSRAVLPTMIAAGGGNIIHIASQLGRVAAPARAAYCASKGAIIQLAKAMAVDHAAQNIRVNSLVAGRRRNSDGWCCGSAIWKPPAASPAPSTCSTGLASRTKSPRLPCFSPAMQQAS